MKGLIRDAKEHKFDLVLVHKIDRLSRNLRDLLNLVDELSSCDVGLKSATEFFDTTTSAGKLMFQQLGSFAEFERNRIAERVFPGMMKGVQRGVSIKLPEETIYRDEFEFRGQSRFYELTLRKSGDSPPLI